MSESEKNRTQELTEKIESIVNWWINHVKSHYNNESCRNCLITSCKNGSDTHHDSTSKLEIFEVHFSCILTLFFEEEGEDVEFSLEITQKRASEILSGCLKIADLNLACQKYLPAMMRVTKNEITAGVGRIDAEIIWISKNS